MDLQHVQDVEQKALRLNMGVFWHVFASQRKMPGDSSFVVANLPDGRSFIVMLLNLLYCDAVELEVDKLSHALTFDKFLRSSVAEIT